MADDSNVEYRSRLFARYASTVEGTPQHHRLQYLRRLVRSHFPSDRGARILEIGCGQGALLRILHERGYFKAAGVDGSAEQVALAHDAAIDGVVCADLVRTLVETPAASLDVVVAFDVLEHFTKAELIHIVDQVQRVLAPGGRFIVHVPNADSPFAGRIRYGDLTHELSFTPRSLGQLLRTGGFEHVDFFEDRPVIHGPVSALRRSLWFCIRALLVTYLAVETGLFDWRGVFSQNMLAVADRNPSC